MAKILLKYSTLVNTKSKIKLYIIFILFCATFALSYGFLLPLISMSTMKMFLLPILFLVLIGIWMMPKKESVLEGKSLAAFYLFLGFWMLWPQYLSIVKFPGDPWMSPQRIIIYILLIFALIMFSSSQKTSRIIKENYNNNRIIFIALIVLVIASLISIFFSSRIGFSTNHFIKMMMFNCLVFFLASVLITNGKRLNTIFLICIFSALILGVISIYENSLSQTIWSYHIPRSMFANSEDLQTVLTPKFRFGDYRAKGSSLTSPEFAELMSYILPICIYYLISRKGMVMKVIAVLTMIIIFYAITTSRSRLGFVGAIVSVANYSFILAIHHWHFNKASLLGPALTYIYISALILTVALISSSTTLYNNIIGSGGHASSTNARYDMWEMGIPLIADRPIFGYGLQMGAETLNYRNPRGVLTIDSFLLSFTLDTGLIGIFAFLILFMAGCHKASKFYIFSSDNDNYSHMSAAIASILISFLVISLVVSQKTNHTLVYMLLGIVTNYNLSKANLSKT